MSISYQEHTKPPAHKLGAWNFSKALGRGYPNRPKANSNETSINNKFAHKHSEISDSQSNIESIEKELHFLKQLELPYGSNQDPFSKSSHDDLRVRSVALEFLDKDKLCDYITYFGGFKESLSRHFFNQLVQTVDYYHKNDMCHRDIKLNSLLLDNEFKLKLADFHVEEVRSSLTENYQKESFLGTKAYQAPELLRKTDAVDRKAADIFAMGVCLFFMRCGHLPFYEANDTDLSYSLLHQGAMSRFWKHHESQIITGNVGQGLSPSFKNLIERMLEFDYQKRITLDEIKVHPWSRGLKKPTPEVKANLEDVRVILQITKSKTETIKPYKNSQKSAQKSVSPVKSPFIDNNKSCLMPVRVYGHSEAALTGY